MGGWGCWGVILVSLFLNLQSILSQSLILEWQCKKGLNYHSPHTLY